MVGASTIVERTRKTCIQQARFVIIPESPAFRHGEYVKLLQLLSARRKEDGISLREAAQRIGISHGYLNKLENGVDSRTGTKNNPTPETLQMIAAAYNWDYQYLLKICGYIDETSSNNALRPCIRELIETCNSLSEADVGYITKFAKFISTERQNRF